MDWLPTFNPPTFAAATPPGSITDPGAETDLRIDPRTIHSISITYSAAVSQPNIYEYHVQYWQVTGGGNWLSPAYSTFADAQTERDRLLAILEAAADAGDSGNSGATTTVTIPEITITADSTPV